MPLLKGKKHIGKNIEIEEKHGKSPKQSLAIALSVSKKPKKMGKGGAVIGVHDQYNMRDKDTPGESLAGDLLREGLSKKSKIEHRKKLEEMKSQPKPKLQGLAEGGMVKPTGPFSVKSRKQLDDEQHQRMMEDHSKINELEPMKDAEEDNVQHPEGLESDNDQMKPSEEEIMADHFAEGGEVESPEMEEAIEHAASIAAAIMSKRKMMAEGGEVELEHNAEEEPNNADEMNMDALGKENYSESEGLDELDQPEDSNEHGHKLEDEHDKSIAGRIRSKMKSKSPMIK